MDSNLKNIALIGMPGSGKTTIGRELANKLGIDFYDSDEYIESFEGMSVQQIFQRGEDAFRSLEHEAIKEINEKIPCVIATGGGIVKNIENIKVLKNNGIIIFINRPLDDIASDINIEIRPLFKGKKENLYRLYDERIELYKKYCDYEIMNNNSIDKVVKDIISVI